MMRFQSRYPTCVYYSCALTTSILHWYSGRCKYAGSTHKHTHETDTLDLRRVTVLSGRAAQSVTEELVALCAMPRLHERQFRRALTDLGEELSAGHRHGIGLKALK